MWQVLLATLAADVSFCDIFNRTPWKDITSTLWSNMYAPFVGTIGCCHKLRTFGVLHKLQVCEHLVIPVCMFCAFTYCFANCLQVNMDGNTMLFDIEGTNVSVSIAYGFLWLQSCRTKFRITMHLYSIITWASAWNLSWYFSFVEVGSLPFFRSGVLAIFLERVSNYVFPSCDGTVENVTSICKQMKVHFKTDILFCSYEIPLFHPLFTFFPWFHHLDPNLDTSLYSVVHNASLNLIEVIKKGQLDEQRKWG